jgi:hypothetical protein
MGESPEWHGTALQGLGSVQHDQPTTPASMQTEDIFSPYYWRHDVSGAGAEERSLRMSGSALLGQEGGKDFFRRVAASGMPLSVRQTGLHNDLLQFATLPVYPLAGITCPTLVMHGRAALSR